MRVLPFSILLPFLLTCTSKKMQETTEAKPFIKIAFGSCAHQYNDQPILEQVVMADPDVFIYLGDNIYSDTYSMDTLRKNYQVLAARPEFQNLKAHVPILATWDDHDYGWNDSGRHYPFKEESKQIFLDFFGVADSSVLEHQGIYYSTFLGEGDNLVQLIFLDMRTFRDDLLPYDGSRKGQMGFDYELDYAVYVSPDSTLLGEQQWGWLEEQLREPASVRIIATSTQFGITHNGYEAWVNFPHEQQRMLDLIAATQATGVVFISGDVHYAEISRLNPPGRYPLYDVTSSGITSTWGFATPNDNRIDGPVMENNFGLITIHWDRTDPLIVMEIIDANGMKRITREVRLRELQKTP